MTACNLQFRSRVGRSRQAGFSILEMVMATAVLMIGIVAVVQLVPASLQSNLNNRVDTTATVVAQRELDQFLNEPLTAATFRDLDGTYIKLGDPSNPGVVLGTPIVMQGSSAVISFSGDPIFGYSSRYPDPNDASGAIYDLRWGVITNVSNGVVISKRIVLGCRRVGAPNGSLPANLDTLIHAF